MRSMRRFRVLQHLDAHELSGSAHSYRGTGSDDMRLVLERRCVDLVVLELQLPPGRRVSRCVLCPTDGLASGTDGFAVQALVGLLAEATRPLSHSRTVERLYG